MALILPAYAKLNLTLDIIGRRPDGYHEIDSVMQTISLHDLIWVERTDCRVFDVVGTLIDGENLVYMFQKHGRNLHIELLPKGDPRRGIG